MTILKETSDAEGFLNEDVLVSLRPDKVQLGTSLRVSSILVDNRKVNC